MRPKWELKHCSDLAFYRETRQMCVKTPHLAGLLLTCLEQRKCNVSCLKIQEENDLKAKHIIISWKLKILAISIVLKKQTILLSLRFLICFNPFLYFASSCIQVKFLWSDFSRLRIDYGWHLTEMCWLIQSRALESPDGPGSGPDSHRTAEPRRIGTLRESDRTCPY